MEITCPKCLTKYRIPEESLGQDGRNVRCKQCEFVWFQQPPHYVEPPPLFEIDFAAQPAPQPEPVVQPTDHLDAKENILGTAPGAFRSKPVPKVYAKPAPNPFANPITAMKTSFVVFACCAVVSALLAYHPYLMEQMSLLRPFYAIFNIYEVRGLSIDDANLKKTGDHYLITCTIKNASDKALRLPPLRVTLRTADRRVVARSTLRMPEISVLKPGSSVPCQNITLDMKHFREAPTVAILDIGSEFDLSLRN